MHVIISIGIVLTVFFILLASICQILLLTSADQEKIKNSLYIWFGSAGIGGVWLFSMLVLALIFYLPKILTYVIQLDKKGTRTLLKIEQTADSIQSLAQDFKKSTKISELVEQVVKLASEAAQSLKNRS